MEGLYSPFIINLIVLTIGALLLFAVCDKCMSFTFYVTALMLIITLVNIYILNRKEHKNCKMLGFSDGESLVTHHARSVL